VSRARLFVALELPADVREALAGWGRACAAGDPALRALAPEALHLTLHFLGERPASEIPDLAAAVAEAASGARTCHGALAGALWLAPRRPHVLTCAVRDAGGSLADLHAALARALAGAARGWTAERRALRPHITVARVRRGSAPRVGREPAAPEGALSFPSVVLLRSHLGRDGARYEVLARAEPAG
jgi:2'-5' RNA ligase